MVSQPVILDSVSDAVLTLAFNRPEKLNAINYQVILELLRQLDLAEHDDAIRAVVIIGPGRAFSAGDDVMGMGQPPVGVMPGAHPVEEYQQRLMRRWFWFPKPTIAGVRGRCHGIAEDIALAADFRIVSRTTILGDMRAKRAIPIGSGGTYLLPLLIGLAAATRLILTGDTIDADTMDRYGLATELVDDDQLETATHAYAKRLATGPTKALGIYKYEMRSGVAGGFDDALRREIRLLDTPVEDREEGRRSFIERREPAYLGR